MDSFQLPVVVAQLSHMVHSVFVQKNPISRGVCVCVCVWGGGVWRHIIVNTVTVSRYWSFLWGFFCRLEGLQWAVCLYTETSVCTGRRLSYKGPCVCTEALCAGRVSCLQGSSEFEPFVLNLLKSFSYKCLTARHTSLHYHSTRC